MDIKVERGQCTEKTWKGWPFDKVTSEIRGQGAVVDTMTFSELPSIVLYCLNLQQSEYVHFTCVIMEEEKATQYEKKCKWLYLLEEIIYKSLLRQDKC